MSASAAIRYVNLNNASPTSPYTTWATAAQTIQDAVDAAVAGDQILVTNGVYRTGSRNVAGTSNRVVVEKSVTVESVNGAAVTLIQGSQIMRCVYLTNGAALVGFTLSDGAAWDASGEGGGVWCASTNEFVSNCVLTGNSAAEGGGGASGGTINNCNLTGNSAVYYGGGAYNSTLNNCTLTANLGGGASQSTLNNCIVYYNVAQFEVNYSSDSVLNYCCTTPLPLTGVGNISAEPQLASASHLSAGSPCRGAGSVSYATGLDIDGETWANPPSIGCDEYHPGLVSGALSVSIESEYTNAAVGFAVNLTASIDGRATASRWEFGDGTVVSNQPYASHSWAVAGDFSVVLQAYNDTNPGGISATAPVHVVAQPTHYVAPASANPVTPYTSWTTAANNIQDAVDAASVAGALVLVTNGVYQTDQTPGPSVVVVSVDKPVVVRSVNGPAVTVIRGRWESESGFDWVSCASLVNGASLVGFTLTNGEANVGGGVWCASASVIVSNCVLTGNLGRYVAGGAYGGTLNNCTLNNNRAGEGSGGAGDCTLNNCTLSNNAAGEGGGGAGGCTLNNCTLSSNTNAGASWSTLNNCVLTGNWAYSGGGAYQCKLKNCTLIGNSAITNSYTGEDGYGGGAYNCTLDNCLLSGNSAANDGGGAYGDGYYPSTLNNCTLTGNSAAGSGGGVANSTLTNCIIYYNSAAQGDNYSDCHLIYSCTTPLTSGVGNLTNAPLFLDYAGGNLRLQSNSPCINAGSNASAPDGPDLDGNPRIAGGTVDMGGYEFQSPQSLISYAWLQQYGLPTDGSADYTDADADGINNWQEWRSGTDPTDATSLLRLLGPAFTKQGLTVRWTSVSGLRYFLERGTNLSASSFLPLATGIVSQPDTTTFRDTNVLDSGPVFYRVGVEK
jgi:hypothetical protein